MFALAWWSLCHLTGSEIRSICLSIPHDRIVVVAHSWCLSGDIGAVGRRQTQRYRSRGAMLTCVWSQREVERDLPFGILHPLSMTYILPSPYLNICYLFSPPKSSLTSLLPEIQRFSAHLPNWKLNRVSRDTLLGEIVDTKLSCWSSIIKTSIHKRHRRRPRCRM